MSELAIARQFGLSHIGLFSTPEALVKVRLVAIRDLVFEEAVSDKNRENRIACLL